MQRVWVICKKIFSISLIFNALLTIACATGILAGFYIYYFNWQPFYPYIIDGNVFWFAIAAAVINIFPSASLGRSLHTGRLLFHHYLYGFLVLFFASAYVVLFTPASLLTIFFVDNTSVAVNLGRFFLLGGFALVLDDLPDVHIKVEYSLNWLKDQAHKTRKLLLGLQLLTGVVSLYIFVGVCFAMVQNPEWLTLANMLLVSTLLVTSLTSFVFVKKQSWLKISPNNHRYTQTH